MHRCNKGGTAGGPDGSRAACAAISCAWLGLSGRRLLLGGAVDDEAVVVAERAVRRRRGQALLEHVALDAEAVVDVDVRVLQGVGQGLVGAGLGLGGLLLLDGDAGVRDRGLVEVDLVLGLLVEVDDRDGDRPDLDLRADLLLELGPNVLGEGAEGVGVRAGLAAGVDALGDVVDVGQRVVGAELVVGDRRQVAGDQRVADLVEVLVVLVEVGGRGLLDLPADGDVRTGDGLVGQTHLDAGVALVVVGALVVLDVVVGLDGRGQVVHGAPEGLPVEAVVVGDDRAAEVGADAGGLGVHAGAVGEDRQGDAADDQDGGDQPVEPEVAPGGAVVVLGLDVELLGFGPRPVSPGGVVVRCRPWRRTGAVVTTLLRLLAGFRVQLLLRGLHEENDCSEGQRKEQRAEELRPHGFSPCGLGGYRAFGAIAYCDPVVLTAFKG